MLDVEMSHLVFLFSPTSIFCLGGGWRSSNPSINYQGSLQPRPGPTNGVTPPSWIDEARSCRGRERENKINKSRTCQFGGFLRLSNPFLRTRPFSFQPSQNSNEKRVRVDVGSILAVSLLVGPSRQCTADAWPGSESQLCAQTVPGSC